jgi:hypothetical protein
MNRHTEDPTRHPEMMRRTAFICLAVVLAALVCRGIGGPKVVSEVFCRVRGLVERKSTILIDTAQQCGEHATRLQRQITALLRALSCIQRELSGLSQPHETRPLSREAAPAAGVQHL